MGTFAGHPMYSSSFRGTATSYVSSANPIRLQHAGSMARIVRPRDSAGTTPNSPVSTDEPPENLRLIPYGCTNLRIVDFPVVKGK